MELSVLSAGTHSGPSFDGIASDRRLPAVDAQGRETLLSLGTFLENLTIGAFHHGYRVDYDVVANSPDDGEIIDVHLRKTTPKRQNLKRIRLRQTVRNGYLATSVTPADLIAILAYGPEIHYFRAVPLVPDISLKALSTQTGNRHFEIRRKKSSLIGFVGRRPTLRSLGTG